MRHLTHEYLRCICGARACTDEYLEKHKRGPCIGEAGRLLRQENSGAPRPVRSIYRRAA